jgi:hypothetical protein
MSFLDSSGLADSLLRILYQFLEGHWLTDDHLSEQGIKLLFVYCNILHGRIIRGMNQRDKTVLDNMENFILLAKEMAQQLEGLRVEGTPPPLALAETASKLTVTLKSLEAELHLIASNR